MSTPPADPHAATRPPSVADLHRWQRRYNMVPRDDSALTMHWSQGKIVGDASVVARELMAVHFIHSNTLYSETIEEFFRMVAHRLRRRYKLSWTSTWCIVRFYASIALKVIQISRCGVRIPPALCPPPEGTAA